MATAGLFFGAGLAGYFGRRLQNACYSGAVGFRRWHMPRREKPLAFVGAVAMLGIGAIAGVSLTCHCLRVALDALRAL